MESARTQSQARRERNHDLRPDGIQKEKEGSRGAGTQRDAKQTNEPSNETGDKCDKILEYERVVAHRVACSTARRVSAAARKIYSWVRKLSQGERLFSADWFSRPPFVMRMPEDCFNNVCYLGCVKFIQPIRDEPP